MWQRLMMRSLLVSLALATSACVGDETTPETLKLLFLGDNGHHQPARRFEQFRPVMAQRGIELTYTRKPEDLNPGTLSRFDGLIVYANIDEISASQAKALLDYVASGKGFIPLHCASYCFRNNEEVVSLIGAQFQGHGTGVFRAEPSEAAASHPIMQGYGGFESWDETYVHTKHNEKDRVVLEYRVDAAGREPWTWVRTHGRGRVFYTAWGHDERTWSNPGFQNLVERGIRWAVGDDPAIVPAYADRPALTPLRNDVKPFEYVEAKLPFYPAGERWGTMGEPIKKMQKPLPPEESIKHFVTPVGFEVQLFASEPDLQGKPITMNWDQRGRLWVSETVDYPNELQPEGKGRDRIRICEDTNGDGRADKFTVFAEQLSIPTTLTFYRGGAIVQDGTRTLYLKDTDGDDRADLRKVLISNWALPDTHGGVSNFQYGLDNWYYGMQGYNNSAPVLTDGRRSSSFRQGFFRFKVEGEGETTAVTEIEFLRSTNNNTWGVGLSEEGLIFGSTANGNPSEYMPIANRYYELVRGWSSGVLNGIAESNRFEPITDKVRQVDHHGGFTAAAGHALYTARAWPQDYWNRTAFVCEPTGHLVATFVLTAKGAGFQSRNSWNILASDDEWSSPIMAEIGPDGQLWVIDWYNIIVQHNPTPAGYKTGKGNAYEIDLRDKKHGRIYRVVFKASPPYEPVRLDVKQPKTLLAGLKHDNMFWRLRAQRLLVERGDSDVIPALANLISDRSVDQRGENLGAAHAVWALHGIEPLTGRSGDNVLKPDAWLSGVEHPSPAVRRNTALAFPEVALISAQRLLRDSDPQVRLATLLALTDVAAFPEQTGEALFKAMQETNYFDDPLLADALTSAAAVRALPLLEKIASSGDSLPRHPKFFEIVSRVAEHYARGEDVKGLSDFVGSWDTMPPALTEAVVAGFARGWRKEKTIPLDARAEDSLAKMLPELTPAARGQLAQLAGRWGVNSLQKEIATIGATFLAQSQDSQLDDTSRVTAATQLVELRPNDSAIANELLTLITARTAPELSQGLIEAIGKSESPEVGKRLVEGLTVFTPAARGVALRVLLGRADWASSLVDGLESGKAQFSDLTLDQKQALTAHPDRRIAQRARQLLAKGGGLPDPDRQKVIDELSPLVLRKADPVKGKEVFKQQCAKCHRHGGEGNQIGPDLTGMAVHPKHELLIQLLDPSRSVEGNFRVYTLSTADGRVLTGLLSSESKTAIEVVDAEAKRHAIQREDIDELIASKKSLMPDGFEKQVPPEAIADVLEFLTQRGKYLPIPLDKVANIITTQGMFNSERADAERLIFSAWSPKTVDDVPFTLIDPQGDRVPNGILFYGPQGTIPPRMPRRVTLPCNAPAKAIHMLSGVSGWGFPYGEKGSVSLIVRLHYDDGQTEDHELQNGIHFADYIRRVDVPESKLAFMLRGQQIRYLAVHPQRDAPISTIELVKGPDRTAPVVMAVTIEGR